MRRREKFAIANRPSDVVSHIHVYVHLVYVHMYAAYDSRFAMANFFSTFPIFCGHSSKITCHPIFSLPDRKNRCRKSDIGCRKSESDTCKQLNINEKKGKDRCRKSAVGCHKPHTCVRRLRLKLAVFLYKS